MLSNDMNRIELILHFLPWPSISIINTTLGVVFLWPLLGYTVLFGIVVLLIVNIVQIFIANFYIKFSAEAAAVTDHRIRLLNEVKLKNFSHRKMAKSYHPIYSTTP